jgi:hypothetical protein
MIDADIDALFDGKLYQTEWNLRDRFGIPPFTTLDTRQGYWQDRKREWATVVGGAEGRRDDLTFHNTWADAKDNTMPETSIFDPVLCEAAVRWWSPPGGTIYDPFAGGPVRGLVAAILGRRYIGVDLSTTQIHHNRRTLWAYEEDPNYPAPDYAPAWLRGDSGDLGGPPCDMVFSCPPYGSLERYSDDPKDLSTLSWPAFQAGYKRCIGNAAQALLNDRFAVFVVGNYLEGGTLRDLVGLTVEAFGEAGCEYHAELIINTAIGTARMRASAQFEVRRRPARTHQTVLVFVKGDARRAAHACGPLPSRLHDAEAAD